MTQPVNVPGHGLVNFPDNMSEAEIVAAIKRLSGQQEPPAVEAAPGTNIDSEIADWSKYGRRGLEYPDAPTTAHLPLPGLRVWNGKDTEGNPGLSIGAKAATLFGPTLTDNPDARQEIYTKHLPGAEAHTDRYGNPMVRYQGKLYYTARPGEFDGMDAGRIATTAAAAAPFMAAAPASLPAAIAIGGLTNAGLSLAEDAGTRLAGGTSQQIDPVKAGVSGLLGAALPPFVSKAVMPVAGRINAAVRSAPLGDAAIRAMGIDPTILTPEQRTIVTQAARRTFGDRQATQSAYRQSLGREFGTDMTRGEISQNAPQMAREKMLSGPGDPVTERTMQDFRTGPRMEGTLAGQGGQEAQRTAAQNTLRGQAGNGMPMTQQEAAAALKQGYTAADTQAQTGVRQLYGVAQNPALLASSGMPAGMPVTHVAQTGGSVRQALNQTGAGRTVIDYPQLAPNASEALAAVERWSAGEAGPRGAGVDHMTWEQIENMRQTLNRFGERAHGPNGTPTDQNAMEQLIRGFDEHFAPYNPILGQARAAHEDRMLRLRPGAEGQDKATTSVLTALQGEEQGASVVNTIFNPAKRGDALQMLEHLNTRVFPDNPEARNVIREQALRRLMVDERTGDTLSPRRTVTAMEKAFDGDAEAPLYQHLFSGEELARMRRYLDLQRAIANGRESPNPSKSAMILGPLLQKGGTTGVGGSIGYAMGQPFGLEQAGLVGGGFVGSQVGAQIPRIRARAAVAPPANYLPIARPGPTALRGSLVATPPARDEIMDQYRGSEVQRLLGGLLGQ